MESYRRDAGSLDNQAAALEAYDKNPDMGSSLN